MLEFLLVGVVVNLLLLAGLFYVCSKEFERLEARHKKEEENFMKLAVRSYELFLEIKELKKGKR